MQSGEGWTPEAGDDERAERGRKRDIEEVCLCVIERIGKELHTVHIDLAFVMVMLQSSDLAPRIRNLFSLEFREKLSLSVWVCTQVKAYCNNITVSWVYCMFTLESILKNACLHVCILKSLLFLACFSSPFSPQFGLSNEV